MGAVCTKRRGLKPNLTGIYAKTNDQPQIDAFPMPKLDFCEKISSLTNYSEDNFVKVDEIQRQQTIVPNYSDTSETKLSNDKSEHNISGVNKESSYRLGEAIGYLHKKQDSVKGTTYEGGIKKLKEIWKNHRITSGKLYKLEALSDKWSYTEKQVESTGTNAAEESDEIRLDGNGYSGNSKVILETEKKFNGGKTPNIVDLVQPYTSITNHDINSTAQHAARSFENIAKIDNYRFNDVMKTSESLGYEIVLKPILRIYDRKLAFKALLKCNSDETFINLKDVEINWEKLVAHTLDLEIDVETFNKTESSKTKLKKCESSNYISDYAKQISMNPIEKLDMANHISDSYKSVSIGNNDERVVIEKNNANIRCDGLFPLFGSNGFSAGWERFLCPTNAQINHYNREGRYYDPKNCKICKFNDISDVPLFF